MVQLAEEVLIAYASPKGNRENIIQNYNFSNKRLFCFNDANNDTILKMGVELL